MTVVHFVHPGDLATSTGGYRYARRLLAALQRRGCEPVVHRLADSFPFPDREALAHASRVLAGIADDCAVIIDGLALGAMPAEVAAQAARLKLIALVHHPLALETGLSAKAAACLEASERVALAAVRAVVVTSPATAAALRDYGVEASRITVALPGTDRAPIPPTAMGLSGPPRLLCVASITPRKGHLDLVEALALCRDRDPSLACRLVCVGSLDRDPACAAALRDRIRALGLQEQVTLAGERDEAGVHRAYEEADVFVLSSYHEGYGMVLAEALAHGLPVVSTTAGAIPQTVPREAGLLVPPGDVSALADAIGKVIGNRELREGMAEAARLGAADLPDWDATAGCFVRVLASVQAGGGPPLPERPAAEREPPQDPLGFSASWLALREPHDHAARDNGLTQRLGRHLATVSADRRAADPAQPQPATLRILDLGCGSGSTFRYLSPRLGGKQHWRMVDRDPALLARLPASCASVVGVAATVEPVRLDLAGDLADLPLEDVDLITASALLDLVSEAWLKRLLAAVAAVSLHGLGGRRQPALLLGLSYDGTMAWQPELPDDTWVGGLFNRHQRSDKGFGPALGPAAADVAARCLQAAGYQVTQAPSPWRLGSQDTVLQRAFVGGVADGAAVMLGAGSSRLQAWLDRRNGLIDDGRSAVDVGHRDLLALPAALPAS